MFILCELAIASYICNNFSISYYVKLIQRTNIANLYVANLTLESCVIATHYN